MACSSSPNQERREQEIDSSSINENVANTENMLELVIHSSSDNGITVKQHLNAFLQENNIPSEELTSFSGEYSTYYYLNFEQKEDAETILELVKKIEGVENAYLKPKNALPK